MSDRKTQEEFEKEIFNINPNLIVKGKYHNNNTPVEIYCPIHDYTWFPKPRAITTNSNRSNCVYCSGHKLFPEDFFKRMYKLNPDIEVLDDYVNDCTKMKMSCKKCGKIFYNTLNRFMHYPTCPKCRSRKRRNTEDYKEEVAKVNPNIEVLGEFANLATKIKCRCKTHDVIWDVNPQNILNGHGCPSCNQSIGEKKIKQILEEMKIDFVYEKTFDDCKDKNVLAFDFYLKDYNLCIEFDGLQHFIPIAHFGGEENLRKIQYHDEIKNNYCKQNGIKLLRIKYNKYDKLEEIIKEYLLNI